MIFYSEAWKQYIHEDQMSQSRNRLFMNAQTIFIVLSSAALGLWVKIDPNERLIIALPMILTIIAIFGFASTFAWRKVNKAGRAYLNLRWLTIRAIEEALEIKGNLAPITLTRIEGDWKRLSFLKTKDNMVQLFAESEVLKNTSIAENLQDIKISSKERQGEWMTTDAIILSIRVIWFITFLAVYSFLLVKTYL